MSRQGGKARAKKARQGTPVPDSDGPKPCVPAFTLQQAVEVIDSLLQATVPGLGEPDLELRALGLYALVPTVPPSRPHPGSRAAR
jgi:hypothetical protein